LLVNIKSRTDPIFPELRDKLARNGMKTAQVYSWRNTALRHEEFYSGVLENAMSV
jgi:hypothetical protein